MRIQLTEQLGPLKITYKIIEIAILLTNIKGCKGNEKA